MRNTCSTSLTLQCLLLLRSILECLAYACERPVRHASALVLCWRWAEGSALEQRKARQGNIFAEYGLACDWKGQGHSWAWFLHKCPWTQHSLYVRALMLHTFSSALHTPAPNSFLKQDQYTQRLCERWMPEVSTPLHHTSWAETGSFALQAESWCGPALHTADWPSACPNHWFLPHSKLAVISTTQKWLRFPHYLDTYHFREPNSLFLNFLVFNLQLPFPKSSIWLRKLK